MNDVTSINAAIRVLPSPDHHSVESSPSFKPGRIVTASQAMSDVVRLAARAGASDAKVLITGETGVGKDLIARHIHASSRRAQAAFVAVNCAGLTETLLESELFGHVRGSFSGAYRDKAGQLQMAHRGTLFLDEVGEMSLRMQALLLRFLENGEIQPVGADHARTTVDVRVIAATHRNLKEGVAAGEFREDLLYRLRVISLSVPPLRDRPEDIPALVESFVARFGRQATVSPAAMQVLLTHRWPGNVRELQNVIEETLALSSTDVIEPADLPHSLAAHADHAHPAARAAAPGGRRSLSSACDRWLFLLRARAPAVPVARHHAPRHPRARAPRPRDHARQLSGARAFVRDVSRGLQAVPELPHHARLQRRLPEVPKW